MVSIKKTTLLLFFLGICGPFFGGWGFFGHKKINRVAVFTIPDSELFQFYKKNIDFLTEHAVDPDKRRYAVKGEAEKHFIDIDHYVEKGDGPLVLFCHGWPESWYSWRHQIEEIGSKGYRAVALHMRGYGKTTKPEDVEAYGITNLVGDVVGAVKELGESEAVVVGHDWGGPVAWYSALLRPDVFRGVSVLSVPFNPPLTLPHDVSLNDVMSLTAGDREYYRLFFQEPGIAEQLKACAEVFGRKSGVLKAGGAAAEEAHGQSGQEDEQGAASGVENEFCGGVLAFLAAPDG